MGCAVCMASWCPLSFHLLSGARVPQPVARHRSPGATHVYSGEQTSFSLSSPAILPRHIRAMTSKQRYFWEAVVIFSVFYPLYALCLHPRGDSAIIPCLVGSLGFLAFGVILIFRHRTFYGLIPFIVAFCLLSIALGISGTRH